MSFWGLDRNGILNMIAWVRIRLTVMGMEIVGTVCRGDWEARN